MSTVDRIPPFRSLPADRLDRRRQHLLAETAPRPPRRTRRRVALVFAAAALGVAVISASAVAMVRGFFSTPRVNSKIAYIHRSLAERGFDFELWVMNANGKGKKRLSHIASFYASPSWSPDEKKLVFWREPIQSPAIYVVNTDGTAQRRLAQNALSPAWSPDGRTIAFTRNFEIWIMNPDGSGQRNLTRRGHDDGPAWSPDGRKIAFTRTDRAGMPQILVMDADGSGLQSLAEGRDPAWSPDGRRIAYRNGADAAVREGVHQPISLDEIYVMNADGSGRQRLTRNEQRDGRPVWSPDGREIAFVRGFPTTAIFVMNADGSGQRKLAGHPGTDTALGWSPDGKKIAFTGRGVSVMNRDGSDVRTLARGIFGSWSPGQRKTIK